MIINSQLTPVSLRKPVTRLFDIAAKKVKQLDRSWDPRKGTPVFTAAGKYTSKGWTEWTQGFQYGCAILVFDATDDKPLYMLGRRRTIKHMLPHVTHTGVHDHGFNNLSTYGNLRRLVREGRVPYEGWEELFYSAAIRTSGAVQAARWTDAVDNYGFIHSFNGPHSLFIDTMRTIRVLGLAHQLGHVLMGENDRRISLLNRLVTHGLTTAVFNVY